MSTLSKKKSNKRNIDQIVQDSENRKENDKIDNENDDLTHEEVEKKKKTLEEKQEDYKKQFKELTNLNVSRINDVNKLYQMKAKIDEKAKKLARLNDLLANPFRTFYQRLELFEIFVHYEPSAKQMFDILLSDFKNFKEVGEGKDQSGNTKQDVADETDEVIKFLFEPNPENQESKGIITSRLWQICIGERSQAGLLQNAINNRIKELKPETNTINTKFDSFYRDLL